MNVERILEAKGENITQAGLVLKVVGETKTRLRCEVIDLFFPVFDRPNGRTFQVEPERQAFMRERQIGQKREFWKTGSRAGFEVGGNHSLI